MNRLKTILAATVFLVGCQSNLDDQNFMVGKITGSFKNVNVRLTDAPKDDVKSVFVNVNRVELMLQKEETKGKLAVAKDLGSVDLLTLQNGVFKDIASVDMPDEVQLKEIRLVLNNDENFVIKSDDSICQLKTPSGQTSGIKIKLKTPITFNKNFLYNILIDFDAKKSIVITGNGKCILKPVLWLKSLTRIPMEDILDDFVIDDIINDTDPVTDGSGDNSSSDGDATTEPVGEELVDGLDTNTGDASAPDGFDPTDPSTWEDIPEDQLGMYF